MGGYGAHDAVAEAPRSPLELQRPSMLTWTEKGERLDAEMHSRNLFSDAYTRQVEALTQKSPFRRFIQSGASRGDGSLRLASAASSAHVAPGTSRTCS